MATFGVQIDAYGSDCRSSALADFLEVEAISGRPSKNVEELADLIRDNEWVRLLRERFESAEEDEDSSNLGEEVDRSREAASDIFAVIAERADTLHERYPFKFIEKRLSYRGDEASGGAYLVLLATTLAHAYDLAREFDPTQFFEEVVERALVSRGLNAAGIAAHRRAGRTFRESVVAAGAECQIRATPGAALTRISAHDEGVDVLASIAWDGVRPMNWIFIGQATCGESNTWAAKMREPSAEQWRDLLGALFLPRVFLAVPHHIPARLVQYLAMKGDGNHMILDRLSLASVLEPLTCWLSSGHFKVGRWPHPGR